MSSTADVEKAMDDNDDGGGGGGGGGEEEQDDEVPITYTDKQLFWNDEPLHAAFLRQNKTRLLEIHVVLAEQSGDYPPGELFEIVTKYDGVALELLRTLQDTNDVLIKDYSNNEGILKVLIDAGIVSESLAEIMTSEFTSIHRCRVLVELPEVIRGTKPGIDLPTRIDDDDDEKKDDDNNEEETTEKSTSVQSNKRKHNEDSE